MNYVLVSQDINYLLCGNSQNVADNNKTCSAVAIFSQAGPQWLFWLPAARWWLLGLPAACCMLPGLPDGESAAGHIGRLCRASGALDRTQRRQLHRCAEVVKVVYSSAVQQLVQHCSGHILRWLQTRLLLCVLHTRLVLCVFATWFGVCQDLAYPLHFQQLFNKCQTSYAS